MFAVVMMTVALTKSHMFCAPSRLVLTLHAYRARAQPNYAQAHLFQPGQGRLNNPSLSTARIAHTSQTNWALVVKRAQARFKVPSVSTP